MAFKQLFSPLRNFSSTPARSVIKNVTVIGAGAMGAGIAQVAAQAGNVVTIVENNEDLLIKGKVQIEAMTRRVAKKLYKEKPDEQEKFTADVLSRLKGYTDLKKSVENTDLLVEAITENVNIKHELFKNLDEFAPEKTIFASNTSSLSIRELASVTKRLDRFSGLHFFNPVPVMKLLEVVKTPELSEDVYQKLMQWGKFIGKTCITCKDTPGFVVNRLLVPMKNEAFKLLERGDATTRDIDIAMKLGAGYPMGPFELSDYTGLDVSFAVLEGWYKKYPEVELFKPSELLRKLVKEGKLGRKTGEGVYKYNK